MKKALAALLSASLVLPTPWVQAQVRLPSLGDSASEDLSVGTERRLGEQIMAEIKRDPAYLDDPVLLDYVRSLWRPLLQAARARGDIGPEIDQTFSWDIFLVQDRSVNAFALPGGHVGVHLGLMAVTATRDELAAVLAHELSHVSQRHIARSMGSASRQGALGVAAMLLGVLIASRSSNPDVAQAAIAGGQAAMIQGQLNFSRDMEREADRVGYGIFRDAGFATPGMAAMFDKLDQASRLNDSGGFPYLRSHPLTSERIAEARSRLTEPPPAAAAASGQGTLHALMQGRARVLMEPMVDNWRRLLAQAEAAQRAPTAFATGGTAAAETTAAAPPAAPPVERAGTLYAGALAAARLGDQRTAATLHTELTRALQPQAAGAGAARSGSGSGSGGSGSGSGAGAGAGAGAGSVSDEGRPSGAGSSGMTFVEDARRSHRAGQLLGAELALARGEPWAANTILATLQKEKGQAAQPEGSPRAELMLRSQAALAAAVKARERGDRAQDATLRESLEALQTWVAEHRQDAAAWLLLAQASDALGLQLRALRAQAEARAAVGDLGAAIDRLRAAQARSRTAAAGGDFIEASVIDTRLRELLAQRRQQNADLRAQRGAGVPRDEGTEEGRDTPGPPAPNGRRL